MSDEVPVEGGPITSITPYQLLCLKHKVDPETALWRVNTSESRVSWYAGHRFHGHIARLYKDDNTSSPMFADVFPGNLDYSYVDVDNLFPLESQEVPGA